jgi:hypothetical protein
METVKIRLIPAGQMANEDPYYEVRHLGMATGHMTHGQAVAWATAVAAEAGAEVEDLTGEGE